LSGAAGAPFSFGPSLFRSLNLEPHRANRGDPLYRPLRIYTLDPGESRYEGSVAVVNVPYEPLQPGPVSALFEVVDPGHGAVDLDDTKILLRDGRDPSPSDPLFHQQMVYAVSSTVYTAFRRALGRDLHWGFDHRVGEAVGPLRLRLCPHADQEENAYYSRETGEIRFGYFEGRRSLAGTCPRATCSPVCRTILLPTN